MNNNNNDITEDIFREAFSKEGLESMLMSDIKEAVGLAELFLDKVRLPDNYWEMPDYYYKGLYSEQFRNLDDYQGLPEYMRDEFCKTANDRVLEACGYKKSSNDKFIGEDREIQFDTVNQAILVIENDNITKIPFSLLCGMLLKARELEYEKPVELEKAGKTFSNSKNTQK